MDAMKLLRYLFLAGLAAMLAGCMAVEENPYTDSYPPMDQVDWYPVELMVYVQDQNGTDMLDPDGPGCIAEGTSVNFFGSIFSEPFDTKAYSATLYGYCFRENQYGHYLYFGEIDGGGDYDEDIVITWGDGSVDTIHYLCRNHLVSSSDITCERSWTLNGMPTSNPVIITKTKVTE